jgi:hypothetical protein
MTDSSKSSESAKLTDDEALKEKQEMVEKLFRHTNGFLQEHKQDPLLIVEALAAILVRYATLLGPVEQMADRLSVLEALIGQECTQIQEIAKATSAENADKS